MLLLAKPRVEELVRVVLAAIPVVLNVPPFNTTGDAKVAVVALGLNLKSPLVTVVVPL